MSFITILIIIFIIFITQLISYKYIRHIDKAERDKLYNWELGYVKQLQVENEKLKPFKKGKKNDNSNNTDSTCDNISTDILEPQASRESNLQATE